MPENEEKTVSGVRGILSYYSSGGYYEGLYDKYPDGIWGIYCPVENAPDRPIVYFLEDFTAGWPEGAGKEVVISGERYPMEVAYPPLPEARHFGIHLQSLEYKYPDDLYEGIDPFSPEWLLVEVRCPPAATSGKENHIAGKWQLIKAIHQTDTVDYSCDNIIYEFVSGNMSEEDLTNRGTVTVYGRDEILSSDYEYQPFPMCTTIGGFLPNIKMGDETAYCLISSQRMVMYSPDMNEYGGPLLTKIEKIFLRIEI
jgi:hypothetical protein